MSKYVDLPVIFLVNDMLVYVFHISVNYQTISIAYPPYKFDSKLAFDYTFVQVFFLLLVIIP